MCVQVINRLKLPAVEEKREQIATNSRKAYLPNVYPAARQVVPFQLYDGSRAGQ